MWTAQIVDKQKDKYEKLNIHVQFFNNGVPFKEPILFSGLTDDASLKRLVQEQIDFFSKSTTFDPEIGEIDLPVKEDHIPTQEEIDAQRYHDDLILYRSLLTRNKILTSLKDTLLDDTLKRLNDNYRVAYIPFFSIINV